MDKDIRMRLRSLLILYFIIANLDDKFQKGEAELIMIKFKEWMPDISMNDMNSIIAEATKLISQGDASKLLHTSAEIIKNSFDEGSKIEVLKDLIQIALIDKDLNKNELNFIIFLINEWGLTKKVNLEDYIKHLIEKEKVESSRNQVKPVKEQREIGGSKSLPDFYNNSTNPKYPGEFYFLTKEYSDRPLIIKNFPGVKDVNKLFRKFSFNEVEAIKKKIESERTIPILVFVKEILESKLEMDVKEPFWFIPFVIAAEKVGCFLYFEENGFYANFERASELKPMIHVDAFEGIDIYPGFDEDNIKYKDSIKTLRIETNNGFLTLSEFFGKGFGSQLEIIIEIWYLWSEVVEFSRDKGTFSLNIPNGPKYKRFHSWEEVIKWATEKGTVTKQKDKDDDKDYLDLPDEVIAKVFKEGGNYIAKVEGTEVDITSLIDNPAKLKYAFERSGLVRGKRDKSGNFQWRVIGKNIS